MLGFVIISASFVSGIAVEEQSFPTTSVTQASSDFLFAGKSARPLFRRNLL